MRGPLCTKKRWAQLARRREEEELVNGARSEDLDDELELHRVIYNPGWDVRVVGRLSQR